MNDWLTVTNRVPPVNDAQVHLRLPKMSNQAFRLDRLPEGFWSGYLEVRVIRCRAGLGVLLFHP
jgi:hypothetical protein